MFLFQVLGGPSAQGAKPAAGPVKPVERVEFAVPNMQFDLPAELNKTIKDPKNAGKTVIAYFWASDCEPCKKYTPELEKVIAGLDKDKYVYVKVDVSKVYDKKEPAKVQLALHNLGQSDYAGMPVTLTYEPNDRDAKTQKQFDEAVAVAKSMYQDEVKQAKAKNRPVPTMQEIPDRPASTREAQQPSGSVVGLDIQTNADAKTEADFDKKRVANVTVDVQKLQQNLAKAEATMARIATQR